MENEAVEGWDELPKEAAQSAAVSLDPEDLDTGQADRREITRQAQLDALEAVAVLNVAMDSLRICVSDWTRRSSPRNRGRSCLRNSNPSSRALVSWR